MVGSCRGSGMMMMMVLHVLHFTGISRRARRRGVIATASEGHVQITARRRHVRGRGHPHRSGAVQALHAGGVGLQVGAQFNDFVHRSIERKTKVPMLIPLEP